MKYILFWRILTVCGCLIETCKLTKMEIEEGLTFCPYHGRVSIDYIKRYPYTQFEEVES